MRLVSLNIGKPTKISSRGRMVSSGISKTPVQKPVHVLSGGLEGDSVLNTKHHGGIDQAVYGYRTEDYDWTDAMEALTSLIEVFCCARRAAAERVSVDSSVVDMWDRRVAMPRDI